MKRRKFIKSSLAASLGFMTLRSNPPPLCMNPTRFDTNPLIHPASGNIGDNINGPTVIRVPSWVPNRIAKYYMYFAHHHGSYIRLAVSDELRGPWKVIEGGCLHLHDTPCIDHIASPEIVLDEDTRRIVMYFHGPIPSTDPLPDEHQGLSYDPRTQRSYAAVSDDGLAFSVASKAIGPAYLRVFRHCNRWWGAAPRGRIGSTNGLLEPFSEFVPVFESRTRHLAVDARDDSVDVYLTRLGDAPEHVCRQTLRINQLNQQWEAGSVLGILWPERDYEGINMPVKAAIPGAQYGMARALRDPYLFRDGDRRVLFYACGGESGIAAAEIH